MASPAALPGYRVEARRPRAAGLAIVLLVHLIAAWLLMAQLRPPAPTTKPVLVPLTLQLRPKPERLRPPSRAEARPLRLQQRAADPEVHTITAPPPAAAAPVLVETAQPLVTTPGPAPALNLALPTRPASAPERHNPALSDPRANSPRLDAGARMAAALGSDPQLQEESLGGGRHRFRQGGKCVETAELRVQQLDPYNASMSVAPRLVTSCK